MAEIPYTRKCNINILLIHKIFAMEYGWLEIGYLTFREMVVILKEKNREKQIV